MDVEARQPAKLHGLARHRKRAGDDGLAGDDGGDGGKAHQWIDRPGRGQLKERIAVDDALLDQERGLAGVAEQKRRQHDPVPGQANGASAEMPHVGVQGLGAGDA